MPQNLKTLCENYSPYDHRKRLEELFRDFDRVLITSSFGTTSAILLHLLHQVKPDHPVHFIDTKYHFAETHLYKRDLTRKWGLNVVPVYPKKNENRFTRMDYTWTYEPDSCCEMNKVQPLEGLKKEHDVWVSGMLGSGNSFRETLPMFREEKDIIRFYPLIDMSPEEAAGYRIIHELPEHPLESKGYGSVGCEQCTLRGEGRDGRWIGFNKGECGLHLSA